MNKNFVLVIGLILYFFMTVQSVAAAGNDITVTCPQDGPECVMAPNPGDPLFYETNMLPGDTVTRALTVINQDPDLACNLEVTAYNDRRAPTESDFPSKLQSQISKDGSPYWNGTIQDIYDQQQIDLSSIPAGGSVVYDWTVRFDPTANNYYQLQETIFDFDVVFSCGDDRTAQLLLTKTNDRLGLDNSPGDVVLYTIKVTAVTDVADVVVVDLPPLGFLYQSGSWTATSSVRGNLKPGITPEPSYQSPGNWTLGDMVADEAVTLTYMAKIHDEQMAGIYPDLAWAYGYDDGANQVHANNDLGFFVGTDVRVVRGITASASYEVGGGQVLGATTLPATGVSGNMVLGAFGLIGIGLLLKRWKRRGHLLGMAIAVLLLGQAVSAVDAQSLSVRLSQPKTPTNEKAFPLYVVTLDMLDQPVTVTCFVKKPGESVFKAYGSSFTTIPGGTSNQCPDSKLVVDQVGNYQFMAKAVRGAEEAQSAVVNVTYVTDSPAAVNDYRREAVDNCSVLISFTTADDDKTNKVEIYRSDSKSFTARDGTRIASISIGSNKKGSYTDRLPDCGKNYYYAVRAFSASGAGSSLVGDQEAGVVVESEAEPTDVVLPLGGAQTVMNTVYGGDEAAGSVLGVSEEELVQATDAATVLDATPSPLLQSRDVSSPLRHQLLMIFAAIGALIVGLALLLKSFLK